MNPRVLNLPGRGQARIHGSVEALTRATADEIIRAGRVALARHGRFDVALAGGATPRGVYRLLAADYADALPWSQVHLFFGDERAVPPDHPDSNCRMVRESLLSGTPGTARQSRLHRMEAESPPALAADRYEEELRRHFAAAPPAQPVFDLVLLGMGTDGHTASLFPGTAALGELHRAVVANEVPQLGTTRITLTFPCLNQAREILFLVAGADKAAMLAKVLHGDPTGARYPAQDIRPTSGTLTWMLDEAAAQFAQPKDSAAQPAQPRDADPRNPA